METATKHEHFGASECLIWNNFYCFSTKVYVAGTLIKYRSDDSFEHSNNIVPLVDKKSSQVYPEKVCFSGPTCMVFCEKLNILTIYLLVLCADNQCQSVWIQIRPNKMHFVGPVLDPNCLTLMVFLKEF